MFEESKKVADAITKICTKEMCHKRRFESLEVGMVAIDIATSTYMIIVDKTESTVHFKPAIHAYSEKTTVKEVVFIEDNYMKSTIYILNSENIISTVEDGIVKINDDIQLYETKYHGYTEYMILVSIPEILGCDDYYAMLEFKIENVDGKYQVIKYKSLLDKKQVSEKIKESYYSLIPSRYSDVFNIVETICKSLNFTISDYNTKDKEITIITNSSQVYHGELTCDIDKILDQLIKYYLI